MDKDSPELDDRIASALSGLGSAAAAGQLAFDLASGSVVADVRLGGGRDAVLMAAVASRLVSEPGLKALVIAPSDREVAGLKTAFDAVVRKTKLSCATIGRDGSAEDSAALIGSIDAIASRVAAGTLESGDFGLIALSDLAVMADIASAAMLRRALGQASPDRRLVAFSSELGPAHRAIARDLGGSYVELELEADGERVKSAPATTYSVTAGDKPRLLLGLLAADDRRPVAVFCSMRDTAEETAKLLRARGVRVDYVLGNLPRKRAVLEATRSGGNDVLVLTDEGASGLPGSWAATLVNWDLPLEGEPYMERLEHLDASKGGARIYNFACERYSFGIPAIERVLGSRLEVVPADESLMTSEGPGRPDAPGRA
ncbi:MAG: DEAD/DEAH box helicase, partial [Spirochaetes bacterium]|nr:DEAD/DEAH box helicase [Spirochaetota bacterium]